MMRGILAMKSILTRDAISSKAWSTLWKTNKDGKLEESLTLFKPLLKDYMNPIWYSGMSYALNNDYDIPHFWDSMSPSQKLSKTWLFDTLIKVEIRQKKKKRIQIVGGWFGYPIIAHLLELFPNDIDFIENIDMDGKAIDMCNRMSQEYGFNDKDAPRVFGKCQNWFDDNPRSHTLDILINTSSEHMPPLPQLLKGKNPNPRCLYVLQSNNMHHLEEHVNCVNSEDELAETSEITEVVYKGSLMMANGYKRFMVIGYQ